MKNDSSQVMYYTEFEISFACPMEFHKFPFDKQTCELDILDLRMAAKEKLQFITVITEINPLFSEFKPAVREYDY